MLNKLNTKLKTEERELKRLQKLVTAQVRKVRKIQTAINKIKIEGVLGNENLTLEKIMKLKWYTVTDKKLYNTITDWLYKNYKYLWQAGYRSEEGGQVAFSIKMDKDDALEPQIEQIKQMMALTNASKEGSKAWRIFISSESPLGGDDYEWDWGLFINKNGKIEVKQGKYTQHPFKSVDEALAWIRENLWYSRKQDDI